MIRDEHLMEDYAVNGSPDAFEELYRRYHAQVLGFLTNYMSGNHADAEDVSQIVWTNVHVYRSQFDSRYPFKNWLFMMAAKKASQLMSRKHQGEVRFSELNGFDPVDDHGDTLPEDAETMAEVERLLAELPDAERELIDARYFQGIGPTDLARSRGVQRMTLHRVEKRAIQSLRRGLGEVAG